MSPDRTEFFEVRGLRLAAHEWGHPEDPTVLCIHGFLDHGQSFSGVADALREGFRVVAPDMRGHGASDWVGAGGYYHFYDYFQDMRRLLLRLSVPVVVVGHSMGGSIATGLAALVPDQVQGLVLLEGMGPPYTPLTESLARLSRWAVALDQPGVDGDVEQRRAGRPRMADLDEAAQRLRRVNPRLSPMRARSLAGSFTETAPGGGLVWQYDPLHRTPAAKPFVQGEAEALWRGVRAPTLSLFGDLGFRPEGLRTRHEGLGSPCVGWVPNAGHNLHHERPELVAEGVRTLYRSGRPELPRGVRGSPPPGV